MLSNARASDGVVDPADRGSVNVAEIQRSPFGSARAHDRLAPQLLARTRDTRSRTPVGRAREPGAPRTRVPSGTSTPPRPRIVPGVPPNSRASVNDKVDCAVSPSVFLAALRTACNGSELPPQPANATSASTAARIEKGSCRCFKGAQSNRRVPAPCKAWLTRMVWAWQRPCSRRTHLLAQTVSWTPLQVLRSGGKWPGTTPVQPLDPQLSEIRCPRAS